MWVQVRTPSGGVRPMADFLGVMMGGTDCVVRFSSSILWINLLLMYARWLLSAVVERVCLCNLPGKQIDLAADRPMPRKISHCY